MQRIIRRGTGETEVIEVNGDLSEEERTKIIQSINPSLNPILLTCNNCRLEVTVSRGMNTNIECVQCGSKSFVSHSEFSMFCQNCNTDRKIKVDEFFVSTHCKDKLWMTS